MFSFLKNSKIVFLVLFIGSMLFANDFKNISNEKVIDQISTSIEKDLWSYEIELVKNTLLNGLKDFNFNKIALYDKDLNEYHYVYFDDNKVIKYIKSNKQPSFISKDNNIKKDISYHGAKLGVIYFNLNVVEGIQVKLTEKEKEFIRNNTVKIGVEEWKPILFSNNGSDIDGICGDFTKLIIQRTGLKITIVTDEWVALIKGLKNETIDLLPDVFRTPKREKYGVFSDGFLKIKDAIHLKDTNSDVHSLRDLEGKILAMQKGNGNIDKISKKFPKIKIILTKNLDDSINRVLYGKATAFYAGQIAVKNKINIELIEGLKSVPIKTFKAPEMHFFSKLSEPLLASIVQKGLQSITYQERNAIFNKWLNKTNNKIKLTDNESIYLKNKKVIKMCVDPNWMPFEKIKNGKYIGISADYITLFRKSLDIPITLVETTSWVQTLEKIKNKQCDILPLAAKTSEREKYLNFTSAHIISPIVLATKVGVPFIDDLKYIVNKKVGMVKGYALNEGLQKRYPSIDIVEVDSIEDGLKKVENGAIFGYLDNSIAINYEIQQNFTGTVVISGKFQETHSLGIASRNDELLLNSIFQKAIDSVDSKIKQKILNQWIVTLYKEKVDYTVVWQVVVFSMIVLLLVLYWNMKLKKEVTRKTKDLKYINENQKLIIKEKTAELQHSLNTMSEYIIYSKTDLKGIIIEASDAFCNISQYSKDELIGKPHNIIRHPDVSKSIFKNMWKTIKSNKVWDGEVKNLKKDGTYYWVQADISPMYDNNGNKIGYLAIRHDITAKKDFEEQHNKLFEAEKLAKEKAIEATKSKSEFLANMSHEIRTPMNGIIGMSHLALQTQMNDKQKNYIQKIDDSAKSLLVIINDILDFSKIEAGKLNIEKIDFDLFKLLESVIHLIAFKIHEKNLEIRIDCDTDIGPYFYGDSLRIGQVLTNLIDNAVKFTEVGGIVVSVKKVSPNRFRFEVSDTGIGLTPKQQSRLFESFSQADGSTTRKYGGTGLGLSITKQLVELMGGKIWIKSSIDEGSTFIFEIDLKERDDLSLDNSTMNFGAPQEYCLTQEISSLKGSKILLVEDNSTNQEIIFGLLENSGIEIDIAHNGKEAIEKFKANKYELIFMDLQMPVMDGYEATRCIREKDKETPVIALSANTMKEDIDKSKLLGMNDHISKPINVEKFYSVLLKYISKKVTPTIPLAEVNVSEDITVPEFVYIDTDLGLSHLAGNKKLYIKVLNDFYQQQKDLKLEVLDDETLKRVSHTIYGLSASIGAVAVSKIAKELETELNRELFPTFYTQLHKVLNELKYLSIKKDNTSKLILQTDKRDILFKRLLEAAKTNLPKKCKLVIEEIEQYELSKTDEELFSEIKILMKKYKLKEIVSLLEKA